MCAGWLWAFGLGTAAQAGEQVKTASHAEAVRLDEEIRKFAQRNIWDAVDSNYARLRGLESKGIILTAPQHELGAQAARELGRMREARARYGLARAAAETDAEKRRIESIIEDIDARYGGVVLSATSRVRRDARLVRTPAPFASDARAAIAYANGELRMTGSFDGLVPVGDYTLGSTAFVVSSNGGVIRAAAMIASEVAVAQPPKEKPQKEKAEKPDKEKPVREARAPRERPEPASPSAIGSGLYAGLGGGSATWLSKATTGGIYVPAGTGASLRMVGGGMWAVGSVAFVAEAGWDGIFGSGGDQTTVHIAGAGAGIAVGSSVVQGRVLGQVGGGWASFTGVEPESACQTETAFSPSTLPDGGQSCSQLDVWRGAEVRGVVFSPGVVVGLMLSPARMDNMGVGLDVGLRGVNGQMIPWTSLGIRYTFGGSNG
jgi:hypothetical protein